MSTTSATPLVSEPANESFDDLYFPKQAHNGAGLRDQSAEVAPTTKATAALTEGLTDTNVQVAMAKTFKSHSKNHKLTLSILADKINALPPIADKKDGYIIHAGVFPEGAKTRSLANIEGVTMLMRDHDGRNCDTIKREELRAKCVSEGIEVIFWDTHTPDENGTTFRAGFPLKEVLAIDRHAPAQAALDTFLGGGPLKPLPASQGFFCQPRPGRRANAEAIHGQPIDMLLDFSKLKPEPVLHKGEGEHGADIGSILTDEQIADARTVIAALREKGAHLSDGKGRWHRFIGAVAPYGQQGYELACELSEGDPTFSHHAVSTKIKQKLRKGATGIGNLFAIATNEFGIPNPATGRGRALAANDFATDLNPHWHFSPLDMTKVMHEAPKPIKWLFGHRMPGNRGGLLTGLGGTSKTQMLYQMAVAAILGNCPWGWSVDNPGKALLILTEDDANDPHITVHNLKTVMGLNSEQCQKIAENLIVYPLAGEDLKLMIRDPESKALIPSGKLAGLEETIKELSNVSFVGIDPALGVTEGDEANQTDQRALGRMADNLAVRCDCAVIILTHGTKGSLQSEEITSHSSRGGGAITDAVRVEYGMRTMTVKEAQRFGINDIAERESYVQMKVTKGNRIPPDAKVPVWFQRGRGGFLEVVELTETTAGGISPRAKRVLDVMVEMDPDNDGVRLQDWRQQCADKHIIGGPKPDAVRKAMSRIVKSLGARIVKKECERGVYLRNIAAFDDVADQDDDD